MFWLLENKLDRPCASSSMQSSQSHLEREQIPTVGVRSGIARPWNVGGGNQRKTPAKTPRPNGLQSGPGPIPIQSNIKTHSVPNDFLIMICLYTCLYQMFALGDCVGLSQLPGFVAFLAWVVSTAFILSHKQNIAQMQLGQRQIDQPERGSMLHAPTLQRLGSDGRWRVPLG